MINENLSFQATSSINQEQQRYPCPFCEDNFKHSFDYLKHCLIIHFKVRMRTWTIKR